MKYVKYALLMVAALAMMSCANWVRVKPVALTAYNSTVGVSSHGFNDQGIQIQVRTLIKMRTLSNRMIEVDPDSYIRITVDNGAVHELYPPLEVVFENGVMVIASQHAAPQTYRPEQIRSVEVQASRN